MLIRIHETFDIPTKLSEINATFCTKVYDTHKKGQFSIKDPRAMNEKTGNCFPSTCVNFPHPHIESNM